MDPLMTVHEATFISDSLDLVGGQNIFADRPRRYPLAADLGRAPPLPPERVGSRDTRYPRVTLDELVGFRLTDGAVGLIHEAHRRLGLGS